MKQETKIYLPTFRMSLLILTIFFSSTSLAMDRRVFLQGLFAGIAVQTTGLDRMGAGATNLSSPSVDGFSEVQRDIAEIRNVIFDFYNGPNQGNISIQSIRSYIDSLRALDLRSDRIRLIRNRQIAFIEERVLKENETPSLLEIDIALALSLIPPVLVEKIDNSFELEERDILLSQNEYDILNNYGRMLVIMKEIYTFEDQGFGRLITLYDDHFQNIWPRVSLVSGDLCESQFL